jgi:hypothetical protein
VYYLTHQNIFYFGIPGYKWKEKGEIGLVVGFAICGRGPLNSREREKETERERVRERERKRERKREREEERERERER